METELHELQHHRPDLVRMDATRSINTAHAPYQLRQRPNSPWSALVRISRAFVLVWILCHAPSEVHSATPDVNEDGPAAFEIGQLLFREQHYDAAAAALWKAVLLHEQTPSDRKYDVQQAFQIFLQCYVLQNKVMDGLLFVAEESFRRNQDAMGRKFLDQAREVDPHHPAVQRVQSLYLPGEHTVDSQAEFGEELTKKTPEELYQVASEHFGNKEYEVRN